MAHIEIDPVTPSIIEEINSLTSSSDRPALPNGQAGAAILSAGIGSALLGFFVVLAEASTTAKQLMTLDAGVGPLSGKTTFAVAGWLIAWAVLHSRWRKQTIDFARITMIALILLGLGLLGTFPPFYMLFAQH
ncbi:MAG: hypothetical protein KatS3mg057_3033 [Herpetosiphonaceae bacterium]|nr:MAG: hypothetical protein KatS3mg057_3033 [Herpetosiphonaceae bacterium]